MSASEVSIPSAILDRWMPKLKDTELRVLLLVARQTIGRSGKEVDWLAHSQLRKRTGRASEAVSAAVDSLIQKGLLEPLPTKAGSFPLATGANQRPQTCGTRQAEP